MSDCQLQELKDPGRLKARSHYFKAQINWDIFRFNSNAKLKIKFCMILGVPILGANGFQRKIYH